MTARLRERRALRVDPRGVLQQDAPHLLDRQRVCVHGVARVDHELGLDSLELCAAEADDAVAPVRVRTALHGDDRMRCDARRDRQLRECAQKRIVRGHVVEAGRQAPERLPQEDWSLPWRASSTVSVVSVTGILTRREIQLDEAEVRGQAAAVRCRDEDHARNERQRLEEERALEQRAGVGSQRDLVEGPVRQVAPEGIAALDHGEAGEQPSLAVADDHHLRERGIEALGVDLGTASRSVSTSTPAE